MPRESAETCAASARRDSREVSSPLRARRGVAQPWRSICDAQGSVRDTRTPRSQA